MTQECDAGVAFVGEATPGDSVMSKVTIYRYMVLNPNRAERRKSRRWGTREGIASFKNFAELLEDTAAEVDGTAVNSIGFTRVRLRTALRIACARLQGRLIAVGRAREHRAIQAVTDHARMQRADRTAGDSARDTRPSVRATAGKSARQSTSRSATAGARARRASAPGRIAWQDSRRTSGARTERTDPQPRGPRLFRRHAAAVLREPVDCLIIRLRSVTWAARSAGVRSDRCRFFVDLCESRVILVGAGQIAAFVKPWRRVDRRLRHEAARLQRRRQAARWSGAWEATVAANPRYEAPWSFFW